MHAHIPKPAGLSLPKRQNLFISEEPEETWDKICTFLLKNFREVILGHWSINTLLNWTINCMVYKNCSPQRNMINQNHWENFQISYPEGLLPTTLPPTSSLEHSQGTWIGVQNKYTWLIISKNLPYKCHALPSSWPVGNSHALVNY